MQGKTYQSGQDYRRAVGALQQAASRGLRTAELLAHLGLCHVFQGDVGEGLRCYRESLEIEPDNADVYLNMGMALKEICEVDAATKVRVIKTCLHWRGLKRVDEDGCTPSACASCCA